MVNWNNPKEVKVYHKAYMKEYHKSNKYKKYNKEYQKSDKYKEKKKEYYQKKKAKFKEYYQRQENKARAKETLQTRRKEYRQKPEVRARKKTVKVTKELIKENLKRIKEGNALTVPLFMFNKIIKKAQYQQLPEVKARIKEYRKEYQQRPEVKERIKEYQQRPEVKERIKEYRKEMYIKENKRRKKLGLKLIGEGYISEKELYVYVKNLLGNVKIKRNKYKTLKGLQLDIYIPKLKLAFEYQGEQHYTYVPFFHKTREEFEALQERDKKKKELCKEKGIILIEVTYLEKLSESLVIKKLKENNIKIKQVCLI